MRPRLKALFCTDFERQRWLIDHAGARIEVALDQGRIHVPGTDLSERLLELELELLKGSEDALMALAASLCIMRLLRQWPHIAFRRMAASRRASLAAARALLKSIGQRNSLDRNVATL